MRTGGSTLVSGAVDRRVPVDVGVSPLLSGDVCSSAVIPGCGDDDGLLDTTSPSSKKGANMTERVPVPSSEHVAEIVGRQGCKIKALRNKTNTYIKTPVRGEEPVFVVTGRQQDVDAACREIVSAAEHFTQIRASRRQHAGKVPGHGSTARRRSPSPGRPQSHRPGVSARSPGTAPTATTTVGVRVPMSMVGLVVGPKGATIKRIQADTGTYIVTPGRDRDPVFEVIGSPDAVERARQHIDAYIETRLAATLTTDLQEGSVLRPVAGAAGEVWSSGELDGMSGRFDVVDNRDAIARLLTLSADYDRPPQPPPPTSTWSLPRASLPTWSSWPAMDDDSQLPGIYGIQSRPPLTHAHPDPDDIISTLYARMLIAETGRTTSDDFWPTVGLSPGCGFLGVGGGSSEMGSFVPGPGGGVPYNDEDDGIGAAVNNNDDVFCGFFDGSLPTSQLRAGGGSESTVSTSAWRLRPNVSLMSAGSCGSDVATSPSYSPAESSSGSAA